MSLVIAFGIGSRLSQHGIILAETLFIQELQPPLSVNVSSEKLMLY